MSRRDTSTESGRTRAVTTWIAALLACTWARRPVGDRGDVPGWVLITLMTAGLVIVLWAVAGPLLVDLFRDAVTGVSGP